MQNQKIAWVFPGQGSQKQGMLSSLYAQEKCVRDTFSEASYTLGFDLYDIIQNDASRLNQTEYTQPAILASSVALWRLAQEKQIIAPDYLAGHSLGEYSALTCAGSLTLGDAVSLVHKRGQLMQQAVPVGAGAMGVILGLDDEIVINLCQTLSSSQNEDYVAAVNFNCQGQVVVAGRASSVNMALEQAKTLGAKRAMLLPVSVPSHCKLMKSAAEYLAEDIKKVSLGLPRIPVLQNADLGFHRDVGSISKALVAQLTSPVNWVKTIQIFEGLDCQTIVECGPGKVLTSLNKRIATNVACSAINGQDALQQLLTD